MCVELRIVFVSTDMIPMDMCRHSNYRLARQLFHFIGNIADAKTCVDE